MKTTISRLSGFLIPEGIVNARVLIRFPVPVFLMALFTVYAIFNGNSLFAKYSIVLPALVIAAYACVSLVLAMEQSSVKPAWLKLLAQMVVAGGICALGWYSRQWFVNLWYLLLAALLLLGNAPFGLHRRPVNIETLGDTSAEDGVSTTTNLAVWDFTHRIWVAAVFATVGSIVFFLGVQAIREAMQQLFGIQVRDLTDDVLLPVGLCFLAPLYWLASIPEAAEIAGSDELDASPKNSVSRAIAFMGSWLLAPLMLVYAAILLAYAVRILLLGNLPDGEVAQLTFPFLILGTLTWLLFEPSFARQSHIAKFYRKIWFPIAMPVAVLLALAVMQRVAAYGLTTQRLALLSCSIWALLVSLYFTLGKFAWRDIRLIPGLAALLMILCGLFGGQLSYLHQQAIASKNLHAAGVLDAHRKFKRFADIDIGDPQAAFQGKEALQYLLRRDPQRTLKVFTNSATLAEDDPLLISSLLEASKADKSGQFVGGQWAPHSSEAEQEIMSRLKLEAYSVDTTQELGYEYASTPETAVVIKEYEILYSDFFLASGLPDTVLPGTDLRIQINDTSVTLYEAENVLAELDLLVWASAQAKSGNQLVLENPVVELYKQNERRVGLWVKFLFIPKPDSGEVMHLQFNVLLRGF